MSCVQLFWRSPVGWCPFVVECRCAPVAGPKLKHRHVSSVSVTSLAETPFNLEQAIGMAHSQSAPLLNESMDAADDELPSPRPHHRARLKLHKINGDGTESDVSSAAPLETNLDGLSLSSHSTVTSQGTPRSSRPSGRGEEDRGDTLTRDQPDSLKVDEQQTTADAQHTQKNVQFTKRGILVWKRN